MPAVPVVVVMLIVVGTLLGVLMFTTNTAVCPSTTVGLLIATTGNGVASVIVPVAVAAVLAVFVLLTFAFSVNVSVPSLMLSTVVGTLTVTLVCPAGIVTVVVVSV